MENEPEVIEVSFNVLSEVGAGQRYSFFYQPNWYKSALTIGDIVLVHTYDKRALKPSLSVAKVVSLEGNPAKATRYIFQSLGQMETIQNSESFKLSEWPQAGK